MSRVVVGLVNGVLIAQGFIAESHPVPHLRIFRTSSIRRARRPILAYRRLFGMGLPNFHLLRGLVRWRIVGEWTGVVTGHDLMMPEPWGSSHYRPASPDRLLTRTPQCLRNAFWSVGQRDQGSPRRRKYMGAQLSILFRTLRCGVVLNHRH